MGQNGTNPERHPPGVPKRADCSTRPGFVCGVGFPPYAIPCGTIQSGNPNLVSLLAFAFRLWHIRADDGDGIDQGTICGT